MPRTNSSVNSVRLSRKITEAGHQLVKLFKARNPFSARDFNGLLRDLESYDRLLQGFAGRRLADCRVLEIGFGARPHRLYAMHASGVTIIGCDLDRPLLSIGDFPAIVASNGIERAAKSLVRHFLFDYPEDRQLFRFLSQSGNQFTPPRNALIVADASSEKFWQDHPGPYDLIFSEDVFEHIPGDALARLVSHAARALSPDGLLVTSPMIFTGLRGGHVAELYGYYGEGPIPNNIPPWDHLRTRKYASNTYLNELRRSQYRDLFRTYFEIVSEEEITPGVGRHLLTDALREELIDYDEDELFSNKVRFVLRPIR